MPALAAVIWSALGVIGTIAWGAPAWAVFAVAFLSYTIVYWSYE